jgi:hypothetical protein
VEELGRKLGFTLDNGNFHNVSLGQGPEVVAEQAMDTAAGKGHWVVLQVILNFMCLSGTQVSLNVIVSDSEHCVRLRNGGAIGRLQVILNSLYGQGMEVPLDSVAGECEHHAWLRNGKVIG